MERGMNMSLRNPITQEKIKINLYFAGLARDCEDVVEKNINNVLKICDSEIVGNCDVLIAENGSKDNTREILQRLTKENNNIKSFLLDGIDERFPDREQRIAHLRNHLFNKVQDKSKSRRNSHPELYIPIDFDSEIVRSIDITQFIKECQRVAKGETDAVFPTSEPYYYDIYALRAKGWVEEDCWNQVRKFRKRKGSFIAKINNIYSKQKSIEKLKDEGRISVQSAFGGVGIYNLDKLGDASYKQDGEYPRNICEHTIFNKSVKSKEISTDFVIRAPREHIKYKISNLRKVEIFAKSCLSDIIHLMDE
jgi:glycosyltransferase involved in cell wall biosynthesis